MAQPVDRDTQHVITLLREAVTLSGLSQASFATAIGTSAPRVSTYLSGSTRPSAHFLVRAQRLGRALDAATERGLMSAPVTAASMRGSLLVGEVHWVWRMLLQGRDHLALILHEGEQELIDSWEAAPTPVGSLEWSALLAAITLHEFESAGLEAPSWALSEPLRDPWIPAHPFLSVERVRAQTPDWLRSHNIYVPARDLVTA